MSAKHGEKGMPGSVPNVKRAAVGQAAKQAQVNAAVGRRKQGSVGTTLNTMVRRSIR